MKYEHVVYYYLRREKCTKGGLGVAGVAPRTVAPEVSCASFELALPLEIRH